MIDKNILAGFEEYMAQNDNRAHASADARQAEEPVQNTGAPQSLEERIASLPLADQGSLYWALSTGEYGKSSYANKAKLLYDEAIKEAERIASQFPDVDPNSDDYKSFIESYAESYYNEKNSDGIVSYSQAAGFAPTLAAKAESKKSDAYNNFLSDALANVFDKPEYTYNQQSGNWDYTGRNLGPGVQQNQRWKDIVYHLTGRDDKVQKTGQTEHMVSGENSPISVNRTIGETRNGIDNATIYPDWFEEYYSKTNP